MYSEPPKRDLNPALSISLYPGVKSYSYSPYRFVEKYKFIIILFDHVNNSIYCEYVEYVWAGCVRGSITQLNLGECWLGGSM